jgi:hypothetical protein
LQLNRRPFAKTKLTAAALFLAILIDSDVKCANQRQ